MRALRLVPPIVLFALFILTVGLAVSLLVRAGAPSHRGGGTGLVSRRGRRGVQHLLPRPAAGPDVLRGSSCRLPAPKPLVNAIDPYLVGRSPSSRWSG